MIFPSSSLSPGHIEPYDIQKVDSNLHVQEYLDVHAALQSPECVCDRDELSIRAQQCFERIKDEYIKGGLSFPEFLPAALANEEYLKENYEALNMEITQIVKGAINWNHKQLEELSAISKLAALRFSPFTEPDFTLMTMTGVRFPIWKGYLINKSSPFLPYFFRNPKLKEQKLLYRHQTAALFTFYLRNGAFPPLFPGGQVAFENLYAFSRPWPDFRVACQRELTKYDKSLLAYLTQALKEEEYEWVDNILARWNALEQGINFSHPSLGQFVATITDWNYTVASSLEALLERLIEITFKNPEVLNDFMLNTSITFPKVEIVGLPGEHVDLRAYFPKLLMAALFGLGR